MTRTDELPAAAREVLLARDRHGVTLSARKRELIADGLLSSGITGAPALKWMAKLVRHHLGMQDYPSPPQALTRLPFALRMATERAAAIAARVRDVP